MKKLLALILSSLLLVSLLAACSPNEGTPTDQTTPTEATTGTAAGSTEATTAPPPPETSSKNTIRLSAVETFTMIDPHFNTRAVDNGLAGQIFESFFFITNKGELEPRLALSFDVSEDGLTYTYHLRQGVKFHSGGEMTSKDVLFSIERAKTAPAMLTNTSSFSGVAAPDDYTIVFTLDAVNPIFPFLANIYIMSEDAGKDLPDGFSEGDCGTGPYCITSFRGDEKVVMTRFDDWYLPLPKIEIQERYYIVDQTTALMAFENGDIDYIGVAAADWERISSSGQHTTLQYPSAHTSYMNFNHTKKPFDDVRVRQAFNYAVNREDVALAAKEGLADVAYYVGNPYYITYLPDPSEIETYPYNPEKAKELLAEAGYPDGLTLDEPITTLGGTHFQLACEVIQQQLADVGVTCEIVPADPSTFSADQVSGNYLFSIMGWSWSIPDWYIYERLFSTGGIGDSNMCFYSNPVVDDLFKQAGSTPKQEDRHKAFAEIIKIISDDAVMIPLYWQHTTLAWDLDLYADPLRPVSEWYWIS